jgi:uncharacterized protein
MTTIKIDTPHGPAQAELRRAKTPRAVLLLGHGAGGGTNAPDLQAATKAALATDISVALITQPYRVAGRRAPAPAPQLDTAWLTIAKKLSTKHFKDLPLLFGGRSSGARVACRTSTEGQAAAVLCLAFPLHPPGRPEKSRQDELASVTVPTLVIQGESDPFGMPKVAKHQTLATFPGTHSLKTGLEPIRETIQTWLTSVF